MRARRGVDRDSLSIRAGDTLTDPSDEYGPIGHLHITDRLALAHHCALEARSLFCAKVDEVARLSNLYDRISREVLRSKGDVLIVELRAVARALDDAREDALRLKRSVHAWCDLAREIAYYAVCDYLREGPHGKHEATV